MKKPQNLLTIKLLKLKYRINDTFHNTSKRVNTDDMRWVDVLICDIKDNNLTQLCKEDMLKCNGLWRKYEG